MQITNEDDKGFGLTEFLAKPLFAHLASASQDGPRGSSVWFLWEDGIIWIISNHKTDSFPHRLELDPRCSVGIVDYNHASGLVQQVGLRGRATVEPFDPERARRLLRRYLGADERRWPTRFVQVFDNPDSLLVRFDPEIAVIRDQSYVLLDGE